MLHRFIQVLCMIKFSIYPKIETGYAFTPDMNDKLVEEFNKQTFNMSAILKIKYYNPQDINITTFAC